MQFADVLKSLMEERGWTNYRLAQELGASQTSVANWLSGERVPHKKTREKIASLFMVNLRYLETGEGPRHIDYLQLFAEPKKESPAQEGEALSDKDVRLLAWFRSLPQEKQQALLSLGDAPEGLL